MIWLVLALYVLGFLMAWGFLRLVDGDVGPEAYFVIAVWPLYVVFVGLFGMGITVKDWWDARQKGQTG